MNNLKLKALVGAVALAVTGSAFATNGYFLPGFGIRSMGMGGVGIAYGRDSLSTAANPANVVNTGMRADMGFAIFNPERSAAVGTQAGQTSLFNFKGRAESDNKYFIVPEMGATMPLNDRLSIGLAVVGNGGMNTDYHENFFSYKLGPAPADPRRDTKLGVDMMQLLVPISAGYKVNENHAIGASLVLAETRFRASGLGAFAAFGISSDPDHMTNQGFDYSYGAGVKVGWLGEFMDDKLTVGLTYASRTWMTNFDKYRGLFAEQGDFDIPENYGIGIAIKPVKNLVIAADVLRINYKDIASIGNRGPSTSALPYNNTNAPLAIPAWTDDTKDLGQDQGMGFGWNNQTVYKLGVQYGVNQRLLVRAGYNYGKSPIPNDQLTFNTLAPATVERHYSLGFTYKASEMLEVTGTYMYVAANNQHAINQNIVGGVDIGMHQNLFAVSFGWVLDPGIGASEYGDKEWGGIDFTNWYAGFGFGQSRYRDVASYISDEVGSGATVASDSPTSEGWKIYGGYQFNKYLGAEGGYANLNDMRATGAVTGGTHRTNVDTDAWTLAAVGTLPLTEKFSVIGKVGAAYMLADIKTWKSTNNQNTNPSDFSADDGYEPYYGVGVSYAMLDNLSLRAEWERFDRKDLNIDLLTAGMVVKF